MSDDVLLIEDAPDGAEGVRLLTLNRPERRNALSRELVHALVDAFRAAHNDKSVGAVMITGAGEKAFCAGGDLSPPVGEGFLDLHHERGGFAELLRHWRRFTKPTVAAVNGMALGGGFGLVLAADFAVAADDASLGTPELKRGLFPMMISRLIYEQLPRKQANELVLLGERVDAAKAVEIGVLNQVVPRDKLRETALDYARRLAAMSPAVMGLGRRAIYRQMDMPFEAAIGFLHDQLTMNLARRTNRPRFALSAGDDDAGGRGREARGHDPLTGVSLGRCHDVEDGAHPVPCRFVPPRSSSSCSSSPRALARWSRRRSPRRRSARSPCARCR